MSTSECRMFGTVLLSMGIIVLLHMGSPREARAEGAKCANDTCKMIDYYHPCPGGGVKLKNTSCLSCTSPVNGNPGRCDGGTGDTCKDTGMPNPYASNIPVTPVCDCQTGWESGGNVEATGNYTGDYDG